MVSAAILLRFTGLLSPELGLHRARVSLLVSEDMVQKLSDYLSDSDLSEFLSD